MNNTHFNSLKKKKTKKWISKLSMYWPIFIVFFVQNEIEEAAHVKNKLLDYLFGIIYVEK